MTTLIFATANAHKLREAAQVLGGQVRLETPAQHNICGEIPETQTTIEGNALQKARFIYQRTRLHCFADDTGLEADALNGAPGVHSARYAGEHKNMNDNIRKLLCELRGAAVRTARFRTIIALIAEGREYLFEGRVEGIIAQNETGGAGFGYDSIFLPEGSALTFAQMTAQQKNAISHRARALQKMKDFLDKNALPQC